MIPMIKKSSLVTVLCFLFILVFVPGVKANGDVLFFPAEKTAEKSTVFSVKVNGKEAFTQKFKDIHYTNFDHNKKVSITVSSSEAVTEWQISPKVDILNERLEGNTIVFELAKPGYHEITVNKKHRLFILTDQILKNEPKNKSKGVISIMSYQVDNTGNSLSTAAIQQALDQAAASKKILFFPAGLYKTGTLKLSSNARVFLSAGAMIKGSEHREDYPSDDDKKESDHVNDKANFTDNGEWMTFSRLILVDNATNVKIWGRGIIDGSGSIVRAQGKPANLIRIRNSKNVEIEGIILRDPACWNTHILHSENVTIRNIKMLNDRSVANTDGFDPDASKKVLIENCFAYCSDDNIAIKTTNNGNLLGDIEDVTISNCVFITKKSALKVGTETKGASMRNIVFKNNYVIEADRGMVLYCYDGAVFENIQFINNYFENGFKSSNLKAIHFQIRDRSGKGQIKNILIKDCTIAPTFSSVSEIVGLDKDHIVDGIRFKNVKMAGKVLQSAKDLGAKTNEFVKNISFEN
jgi:polygalacturonase